MKMLQVKCIQIKDGYEFESNMECLNDFLSMLNKYEITVKNTDVVECKEGASAYIWYLIDRDSEFKDIISSSNWKEKIEKYEEGIAKKKEEKEQAAEEYYKKYKQQYKEWFKSNSKK